MKNNLRSYKNRSLLPRLTNIHQSIDSGSFPSKSYLADQQGVSERTIERDIHQMRNDFGAPIEHCPSKRGYYYTSKFSGLVLSELTEREEIALLMAQVVLNSGHLQDLSKTINQLIKNTSKFPEKFSLYHQLDERISCSQSDNPTISEDQIVTLVRAIFEETTLRFDYQKPGAPKETRTVSPYHLTNAEGEWYLKAHCVSRDELRTFKLPRISNLKPINAPFRSDPNYDIQELIHSSMGGFSGNKIHEIRIQLDAYATQYLIEKEIHETQDLEIQTDKTSTLTLHLNNLMDIKRWVLSWGEHAIAISPPELVKSIQTTLKISLENHK